MQENKVNCNGRIKIARFGFRGGGSRNSRSSGKRHSSAGRRSGSWSSSSRKGSAAKNRNAHKSSQGGVVAYSIYDSRGKSGRMWARRRVLSVGLRSTPNRENSPRVVS